MTREKALIVRDLLFKIEKYEALIEEILMLESFEEQKKELRGLEYDFI